MSAPSISACLSCQSQSNPAFPSHCQSCKPAAHAHPQINSSSFQPIPSQGLPGTFHAAINLHLAPQEHKEVEMKVFEGADKICCICLLMGKETGHHIITVNKKNHPLQGDNPIDEQVAASVIHIKDELFQEKKDCLCRELEFCLHQCCERLNLLEYKLKKNKDENSKNQAYSVQISVGPAASFNNVEKNLEDDILKRFAAVRKELDTAGNQIRHCIEDMRSNSLNIEIENLRVEVDLKVFDDFLDCTRRMNKAPHAVEEKKQEEDAPKERAKPIDKAYSAHNAEGPVPQEVDNIASLIAANFNIIRVDNSVEFELGRARTRYESNLRHSRNWGTFKVQKLKLVIRTSLINKHTKPCLDYILGKSYFGKVELIVMVDLLHERTHYDVDELFTAIKRMRTLTELSLEIIDSALANSNGNGLLAFVQGRLPKNVTKNTILGHILTVISYDLGHALVSSSGLEYLGISLEAYGVDNKQFIDMAVELSCLNQISSLNLRLSGCHMITAIGVTDFLGTITRHGVDNRGATLDIQDCDRIPEGELDRVLLLQKNFSLTN